MHEQPELVFTVDDLRRRLAIARREGRRVGLAPTMGALHAGHASLVDASRAECGCTVATIFVNPTQFGPNEDYSRYPRTLEADLHLLAGRADMVFVPEAAAVYPPGHATRVEVGGVAARWEGEFRPGHFGGVATVVLKLFNMVGADVAYFGQKDYQQVKVVEQMVRDLDVPIAIRVCPIVREPDGLAMSSRNRYLSIDERRQALVLWQALQRATALAEAGENRAGKLAEAMRETIANAPLARIDYAAVVDRQTLEPLETIDRGAVALLAVRVGGTRLIDNCLLPGRK